MGAEKEAFQNALTAMKNGNLVDAERSFKSVLSRQPDNVAALNLLTAVLMGAGRYGEAERFIARAVALNQSSDVSYYNYGLILKSLNKPQQSLIQFNHAIRLNPKVAETWNNRGAIFNDLGQYENAVQDFDRAVALAPQYAEAFCNKGKSLVKLRRFDDALAAYDRAQAIKPDLAEALLGKGNVFENLNRYDEALALYKKSLSIKPSLAEAWLGCGNVFLDLRRYGESLAAFDKGIEIKPDLHEAWLGRGHVFYHLMRYDEALSAYDKALAIKDDLENVWLGRGNVFYDLKRYAEALAAYDRAFVLKPDLISVEGARLFSKMNLCDWDQIEFESDHLISSIRNNKPAAPPWVLLGISSSREDQYNYAKGWIEEQYPSAHKVRSDGKPHRHDKLRIAYVSSDLREHPVAYLAAGVFEMHDRSKFEVTAVSIGPDDQSPMRRRLVRSFDRFIDANALRNDQVAQEIKDAEIDIVIDLNGLTQNARTDIFAGRPAPIQVNWLGYAGTMGAGFIDYIIGDPTLIPLSHQNDYAEKIVHLPHNYMPHDDAGRLISSRPVTRDEAGLPENGFVFCCFNNSYKLNPGVFRRWMALLRAVEGSVLWLSEPAALAVSNLRKEASSAGINPDRLIFAKRVASPADHLARHRLADLFLDTLPYNAHTTASDALWAGLPVLTQIGETFAGRVAASLLMAIGLPELVAETSEQYERIAIDLATQQEKLPGIKRKLAANRAAGPLFNTGLFTRHLEAAYVAMIDRHHAGLAPAHIAVSG